MPHPVLVTGFEPFLDVRVNPSGEVAKRLDGRRIAGSEVVGRVLPVAFARAPDALDAALEEAGGRPRLVLAMGVHRGSAFRLETRARARFESAQADNDGVVGAAVEGPEHRASGLDVAGACARALRGAGAAEVAVSDDAGGYLCERVYRAALDRGAERGVPALFLHVPPVASTPLEAQERVVEGFLAALLGALAAPPE